MTAVTTTYSVNGAAGSPVNLAQLRELVAATGHLDADARVEVVKGQSLLGETKTATKVSVAGQLVEEPGPIKVGDRVRVKDAATHCQGQEYIVARIDSDDYVLANESGKNGQVGHVGPLSDFERA